MEKLPEGLSERDKINTLSRVFYGVTEDGNQLVTVTAGLREVLPGQSNIEDKIRVFSIYAAEDTIPTYEQLTIKRFESVTKTFEK